MDLFPKIDINSIIDIDTSLQLDKLLNENSQEDINEPPLFENSNYYNRDSFFNLLQFKNNNLNLITLNCQSLNSKFEELQIFIETQNSSSSIIHVICLQETWLSSDCDLSSLQIQGYHLVHSGKSCSLHGGVGIYIHDSIEFNINKKIQNSKVFDGLFIEITVELDCNTTQKLIIGNIYRPPRQNAENIKTFMDEISEIINTYQLKNNVILVGDFNFDLLKYKEINYVNEFLELMISDGYIPKITLPSRLTHRKGTLIDNIFVKITTKYSTNVSGIVLSKISDHLPCFISLSFLGQKPKVCQTEKYIKITVNDSNPNAIAQLRSQMQSPKIQEKLNNILAKDSNESYKNFLDILYPLLQAHFPLRLVKFNKYKHKKNKWITVGILKSIRYKDKLYLKLKSLSINDIEYENTKTNLKTYSKILRNSIRIAKKIYYGNIFNTFKNDMKNTWKTINQIINKSQNKKQFPKFMLVDKVPISNNVTIANNFNKYFTEIGPNLASKITTPINQSYEDYLHHTLENNFVFQKINEEEIIKIITSLKTKSSCGHDRLSNKLIKHLKYELASPLCKIVNQMFSDAVFPESLKIAKVIPIYKKGDANSLENYRPISILPSVSKVFEKIMYNQIDDFFNTHKLFYNSQYGFRKRHSTEHAALELTNKIISNMDENKFPINIYLDLSKAFDTLDHEILLAKLKHYQFDDISLKLLNNYLKNRIQYVDYNNTSSEMLEIKCGVPQGSILGPLLFTIYMNDFANSNKLFHTILYADDATLFTSLDSHNITADMEKLMNNDLESINNWFKLNKLSLNAEKTRAIAFHPKQRHITLPSLKIDNVNIEFVSEFKFLGIIIDNNLTWKSHINMISKKLTKIIGIIHRLKNILEKNILIHIYNSLFLTHLNYSVIVWGWQSFSVNKLQKKALRILTNSAYKAHTEPLFKELNLLKFEHIRALHDFNFCFKFENKLLPEYFKSDGFVPEECQKNYFTRHSQNKYRVPMVRHDFATNGISYRLPIIHNTMPNNFKEKITSHSQDSFKKYIKLKLLESYNETCSVQNCYVCGT